MGRRLHVGGRVHMIGLSPPSTPSLENEVSGDLEDRAIFVSGDVVDGDREPEAIDDERRGVSGRVRLPEVVMMI